jgi:EAL domain-containing protein (putative c-di-GMP-specific phosphodiesterase class I)
MDMALTRDIDRDPARRALTGALVQLAQDIGCKVVAEGIETVEERDAMATLGVHCGQGYFFARPLPVVAAHRHMLGLRDDDAEPDLSATETRGTPSREDQPILRSAEG